ncbi:MAG TPA: SAM-dependent methyltransferase [Thermoanaerobaculia bacterium]|nr:SAM-dependent methyltransferase [Thermoanaerobaculia bacterium]
MTESSSLGARLAERIRREGPLRFDVFQQAALYDPDGGYYERPGRVGRAGDFVTGPSWHPAFGRTIARIARRVWEEEEEKISAKEGERRENPPRAMRAPIDLVDIGAGEGDLLAAAHEALESWGIREGFRLIGIERSAVRRESARRNCPSAAWLSSLEEISSPVSGLIVAYELFDALPVRALFFDGEELQERVVTLGPDGEGFAWGLAECVDGAELLERFRASHIRLLRNQHLEIRPGAAGFARVLAARLSQGLLLVFDYGAPARALYSAARPNGTLEAFHAHSVTRDVLSEPGERDITSWVDFTELHEAFGSLGLDVAGPVSQARVLSAAGIGAELEDDVGEPISAERAADRNAIARLVAPGGMGESIRVLLASRGSHVKGTLLAWPGIVHPH